MKHLFLLALSATMVAGASAAPKADAPKAAPAKDAKKTLNYCPIAGEKLHAKTVGATTYKGYNIAFCCRYRRRLGGAMR